MKDLRISKDFASSQIIVNQNANEHMIEQEIEQLRTQFSKAQAANDSAWNSSVLRVLFKNESFARKYRVKIEKFLKDLLDDGEEFVVYHPTQNGEQEFEDNNQTFQIDKLKDGSFKESENSQKVPFYSANFEDTLKSNPQELSKKSEQKSSMLTCFNCLGNHHMKQCPDKIDWARINANKKEILMSGNTIRYHDEEQKNSLKPGKLSENLRNALGLKKNQLPMFIYHMRVIGYPPGWMNEAVFENSGLFLYDSDGKAVIDELSMPSPEPGTMYDGTKFIEFPGFNAPVPEGFIDEWKELKMPCLQAHQQLTEAVKSPNIIISSTVNKRKQILCNNDIDSKKLKNVAEQTSSPLTKGKITENDCTSPEHRRKTCDFKTPDSKQTNKRHSMSISMSPGTPVLEQGNPFIKLPDADKFAQGITEYLPFENLPDSVGTFEKMRGVISSVQKKLIDINTS